MVEQALKSLMDAFTAAGFAVSHYRADLEHLPLLVYGETGEVYEFSDNKIDKTVLVFDLEYFTAKDWDENKERIKNILSSRDVGFSYRLVYHQATRIITHHFTCEMVIWRC